MAFNTPRPGSLKLPGELEVKGNPDKAVVDSSRVRGGAWSVASNAQRNAIPADLRLANVTRCFVESSGKEYVLRSGLGNGNWVEIIVVAQPGYTDLVSRAVTNGIQVVITHNLGPGVAVEKVLFLPDGSRGAVEFGFDNDSITDTEITIEPTLTGNGKVKIIAHQQ